MFVNLEVSKRYLEDYGAVKFAVDTGFLRSSGICVCGQLMTCHSRGKLKVPQLVCVDRLCRKRKSSRVGSIFQSRRSRITPTIVTIMGWLMAYPLSVISCESGMDLQRVREIVTLYRELITTWLIERTQCIGGPGSVVVVRESACGRLIDGEMHGSTGWMYGGIECGTKKCFLMTVDQRDAHTLTKVVEEFVEPGSTVFTDCSHESNTIDLNSSGYVHVKKECFDWQRTMIMRNLRHQLSGMNIENAETHLVEYIWRAQFIGSTWGLFDDLLEAIETFYPERGNSC